MPKRANLSDTLCPVGRSAELLGDRAVLLILRELFFGRRRFEVIAANTALRPQLVSARLKLLVTEGIAERRAYQERPVRHDYWLTDKGKALFEVLYAMRNWAERWAYAPGETGDGHAIRYIHRACGADVGTATICPGCGASLGYGDLKGEPSSVLKAEQIARAG
ncbi:DNA-binding HxlR family transcriptional regulator [Sphingopyxis panaciterrae]|uniref:winged helix-turn-helix transcriptional regulator n=1 Tax=Sphingopyxis panaciterrae TaxID=363841 RepID=UPI0014206306|nr:helix-turn-helix domain-containing protein [Sphingopyxis panaciterrae]NIJ38368.1 DNA-binding HxlR family transcriptional regulator [Sphingopyxis panaciterrae]